MQFHFKGSAVAQEGLIIDIMVHITSQSDRTDTAAPPPAMHPI